MSGSGDSVQLNEGEFLWLPGAEFDIYATSAYANSLTAVKPTSIPK